MQHFCQSRNNVNNLIKEISKALKHNGVFIGSTIHEESLYLTSDAPAFGVGYNFELTNRITLACEYRVHRKSIIKICRQHNLHLMFWRPMHNWLLGANCASTDNQNKCYVVFAFLRQRTAFDG